MLANKSLEFVLIASARLTGNNSNNPFDEQKQKLKKKIKRKFRFAIVKQLLGEWKVGGNTS